MQLNGRALFNLVTEEAGWSQSLDLMVVLLENKLPMANVSVWFLKGQCNSWFPPKTYSSFYSSRSGHKL